MLLGLRDCLTDEEGYKRGKRSRMTIFGLESKMIFRFLAYMTKWIVVSFVTTQMEKYVFRWK